LTPLDLAIGAPNPGRATA